MLQGRLGAYTRWANGADGVEATAAARKAFLGKFERQVDPDGTLAPAEREKRAAAARKAHYARMSLARWKKRRSKKAA